MFKDKLNRTGKKIMSALKSFINRKDPAEFFIAVLLLSAVVFFVVYLCIGNGSFSDLFFLRFQDLFMDYFNSVRDASQGAGVYTERHVIYPPLANLLFLICARFGASGFNYSEWESRKSWINYPSSIFLFFLIAVACCILIFAVFSSALKRRRAVSMLFAFFAVFNVPVLYMLERGNILVLCYITLAVFAFTYNSERKVVRELGLICLAFATAIKIYPGMFMWILLADKRFREFARCMVYTLVMTIIPSFFFGGPKCLIDIIRNVTSFSSSSASAVSVISRYLHIPSSALTLAAYLWFLVCGLCFAAAPFIKTERWKVYIGGFVTILACPPLTALYGWSFMLIPMTIAFNKNSLSRKDWVYMALMCVPFVFTLFRFNYYLSINSLMIYVFTGIVSIFFVLDTVKSGISFIKTAKQEKAARP
ncbi:MAG: glycosyltransferase family 87 protein [Eubacteriales bacterium]